MDRSFVSNVDWECLNGVGVKFDFRMIGLIANWNHYEWNLQLWNHHFHYCYYSDLYAVAISFSFVFHCKEIAQISIWEGKY